MTAPQQRPRVVTAAFWCWLVASVLLIFGGLIAASVNLPAAYLGAGVVTVLAGAGMAFLAGRSRGDDPRFRRAAVALSLAIVVLVALASVVGIVHLLTRLAIIPLIAGTVLITRPGALSSTDQRDQQ
jgi:peptidoglycan/LPS O-acetylase OafA/YrhL